MNLFMLFTINDVEGSVMDAIIFLTEMLSESEFKCLFYKSIVWGKSDSVDRAISPTSPLVQQVQKNISCFSDFFQLNFFLILFYLCSKLNCKSINWKKTKQKYSLVLFVLLYLLFASFLLFSFFCFYVFLNKTING